MMTEELLIRANYDSNTIKVFKMEVDVDGDVVPETDGVEAASIRSFLSPLIKYNCPDALLKK